MPRHSEQRPLPYSAAQMYDLVADVRRYPEFLPWVVAMRVRSDGERETTADMIVGFKALREKFTSRVVKEPKARICIDYIDGPLKYLHNEWQFRDTPDGGCVVDFTVDFQFRNRLFEALAGQFFETALRRMIGAFEARAAALYASPSSSSSPRGGSTSPSRGSSSSSAHSSA
jgi:coenzyme Q-binding protein COQ10